MVECPVTGEKIHKNMAVGTMEYKGKTYYFCCPDCIEKFKQNPEKFIEK
jgi:YHS domain-containing protein